MTQNQWGNLNKDFINAVRGGGHRFMKVFHKIPVFFEGWLPLEWGNEGKAFHLVFCTACDYLVCRKTI